MRVFNLQVAKWGNSLALRIPVECVRSMGIKEGDNVEARITIDGGLSIKAASWDRRAFANEIEAARRITSVGESVMDEVRRGGLY